MLLGIEEPSQSSVCTEDLGNVIWGSGVDLYTTPTAGQSTPVTQRVAAVRGISTDGRDLCLRVPRHLCALLPAVLESEAFNASMLGVSASSDGTFARLSLKPAGRASSEAFGSEELSIQVFSGHR